MVNRFLVSALLIFGLAATAMAQPGMYSHPGGSITGSVYDSTAYEPVEYANIVLFSSSDSGQVTGTISDQNGGFTLENIHPGRYFMEIRFMGYKTKTVQHIAIKPGTPETDVGRIDLPRTTLNSESVVVEGKKPAIEYKIDRKVVDVSQMQTAASGNAIDILENVPSVSVDIEGNVSLRGSQSFTVLIDGRPTVLEGSDALEQIPASSIKDIEIITNPSAKYDPDGTAGIINVVLKKEKYAGSSGMVNLDAGVDNKYSGNGLYSYRNDKYTVTLGLDYGRRYYNGVERERNSTTYNNVTTNIQTSGSSVRGRDGGGARGSIDYNINKYNKLTLNTRYGSRLHEFNSDVSYTVLKSSQSDPNQYINQSRRSREGSFYAIDGSYLHQFNQQGHKLTADLDYHMHDGVEKTLNSEITPSGDIYSAQKALQTGPHSEYELKLEYVYPHGKNRKFEAGYQSESDDEQGKNKNYEYDTTAAIYQFQPVYSNNMTSFRNTQSVYSLYSGQVDGLGYQLGLRGEYTFRNISHPDSSAYFHIDRWDAFPSLHLSYSFAGTQQVMTSYSRRIDRPRSWYLEPYITKVDAYTVRSGNPALVPEYIDSYELGYQTNLGPSMFNFDTYYRVTHNKIERVRSVYAENVTMETIDNIGQDYSLGGEFNFRFDMLKHWNLNLMGDVYNYRVTGSYNDRSFDRESFNWNARMSNNFKLSDTWQVQLDGMYHSPSVSAQGKRSEFYMTNLSVRKDFMNKKLSAILQVRDLFDTAKWEFSSEGPDFSSYTYHNMDSPIVMLTLKLNINNYKEQRNPGGFQQENGMDGGVSDF